MNDSTTGMAEFDKYRVHGPYHYLATIGTQKWWRYNLVLASRYLTAARLLEPHAGDSILDAGSGEGVASLLACRAGASAIAVELDPEGCRLGRQIAAGEGFSTERLNFVQQDIYQLAFADATFDKAVSLEVVEHMARVPDYLREIRRVLRQGGCFVLSTPMKRSDGRLQDRYHVEEFDHASLQAQLAGVFSRVEMYSGWPMAVERAYISNQPFLLAAKLRRAVVRFRAWRGDNPFVGPVAPDPGSPLIFARAFK